MKNLRRLTWRVGKILKAEKVKSSDKLLVLEVDLRAEKRRLVVSLAEYYQPEYFLGRYVVIVANLKARKIRGVESHGMILAAVDDKEKPYLLIVEVKPGAKIF